MEVLGSLNQVIINLRIQLISRQDRMCCGRCSYDNSWSLFVRVVSGRME